MPESVRGPEGDPTPTVETLAAVIDDLRDARARDKREFLLHGVVDQAVGVLVARSGSTSDEAFGQLLDIERRSGRPLLEIASELVGEALPSDLGRDDDHGARQARSRPTVLAMDRASDADELARLLTEQALGWSAPAGAAIALIRQDDILEVVGSSGFPPRAVAQWRWIPPAMDCLMTRAVRTRAPVWTDATSGDVLPLIGQSGSQHRPVDTTRMAVPLVAGRTPLGVVEVAWPAGTVFDTDARRDIVAAADAVAGAVVRATRLSPDADADGPDGWIRDVEIWQSIVDGVGEPAVILRPVLDDRAAPTGFRIAVANRAASELLGLGTRPAGRRLLEVVPWLASSGAFGELVNAFTSRVPVQVDPHRPVRAVDGVPVRGATELGLSAARIGEEHMLLSLRPAAAAPVDSDRWARLQHLGRVGSWEWDLGADEARWSVEALRILGSRGSLDPTPVASPPFATHPDDVEAVDLLMSALVAEGRPAEAELRILHDDGGMARVRFAGEPVGDSGGTHASVFGIVQDVTDLRRVETALEVAQVQLAAQRSRVDAERQLASLLQQIILPSEPVRMASETGVEVVARYRPASSVAGVGGDWYGIFPLPDARVLLTVGDVAGHGLSAASAMAQLYHAVRGLAFTGAGPAEIMTWLNTLTCRLPTFTIASACCAIYDPARRELSLANAGHPSPVMVSGAGVEPLSAPIGTMLGASPVSGYEESVITVDPRDVLVLYTDGLVERRRQSNDETTAHLLAQAALRDPDLDAYVDRILEGARSDTDDDTCLIAVRFR